MSADLFEGDASFAPESEEDAAARLAREAVEILLRLPSRASPEDARRELGRVAWAKACLRGRRLNKSMVGMGVLWDYFPHAMNAKVRGVSLSDKLTSNDVIEMVAKKAAVYCLRHEGGKMSVNRARQSLKAYCGHHVSNFRPVAARDIVVSLVGRGSSVFDPCAGWGGRMMGATAAHASYSCVDASAQTASCLLSLSRDIGSKGSIVHAAIEDVGPPGSGFDLSLTSPPYFNAEVYSGDSEQSCNRYKAYPAWVSGFLIPMVDAMATSVSRGGWVAVNVANVFGLPLIADTRLAMGACGLSDEGEYAYVLSSISGKGEKSEPVLLGRKLHPW